MQGYHFTDRVRRALGGAREEAAALGHNYVGTEHVLLGLLGLLREPEGVATATLANLHADRGHLRGRVLERVGRPMKNDVAGPDLPYTSRAKKALELAMLEARELGSSYVGTEHLLLGLRREEAGLAAQVLESAGLSLEMIRAEVDRLLGPERRRVEYATLHPMGARALFHPSAAQAALIVSLLALGVAVAALIIALR